MTNRRTRGPRPGSPFACSGVVQAQVTRRAAGARNDGDAIVPNRRGVLQVGAPPSAGFGAGQGPRGGPGGLLARPCDVVEMTDVLNCNLGRGAVSPRTSTITGSNTFTIHEARWMGWTTFTFRLRNQFRGSTGRRRSTARRARLRSRTRPSTTRVATLDRAYNDGEVFTLKNQLYRRPGLGRIVRLRRVHDPEWPARCSRRSARPYYAYTWWPCKGRRQPDSRRTTPTSFTSQVRSPAPKHAPRPCRTGLAAGRRDGRDRQETSTAGARTIPLSTYLVFINCTQYTQWQQDLHVPAGRRRGNGTMGRFISASTPANDTTPPTATSWGKTAST